MAPGEAKQRLTGELIIDDCGHGDEVAAVAGDGRVVVYSTLQWRSTIPDPVHWFCGGTVLTSGEVVRVPGRREDSVPGAPPTAELAVSGDYVALVVANSRFTGRRVEVRSLDGRLASTVTPGGDVAAVALSQRLLGLAVGRAYAGGVGVSRLEFYDVATGRLRARVAAPNGTAPALAIAGTTAVFASGRSIRTFNVATRRMHRLVLAGARPVGLSIVGGRLAWRSPPSATATALASGPGSAQSGSARVRRHRTLDGATIRRQL
jgi:hypothetical protein